MTAAVKTATLAKLPLHRGEVHTADAAPDWMNQAVGLGGAAFKSLGAVPVSQTASGVAMESGARASAANYSNAGQTLRKK